MGYGYGLGVYFEDYNDPEEPDFCIICGNYMEDCECPEPIEESAAEVFEQEQIL